jgi:hypothetical protein
LAEIKRFLDNPMADKPHLKLVWGNSQADYGDLLARNMGNAPIAKLAIY